MNTLRPLAICLLSLGPVANTSAAQMTTLSGVILSDRTDAAPVPGASVREVGTANAVVTDRLGHFVISLRNVGPTTVEIVAPGYELATVLIDPVGQDSIDIHAGIIRLTEASNGLPERRAAGRGVIIDRAQFERWSPATLTDLLRHVRGLRIRALPGEGPGGAQRHHTATMARGPDTCSPVAFVDGAYMGPVIELDLDDLIAPDDLSMVEIYRSPSEVPPRFDVLGASCGVLAFWTRVD